jgi:acetyl/propionyl-CoA carboxylase alpha subunit
MSNEFYLNNELIHKERQLKKSRSKWVKSFDVRKIKPLIICRGPIRKEAMDVFTEMGIQHFGILLSEKDSVVYQNALAPELRQLTDPSRVHRVPDYTGADKAEREVRIQQIIAIAKDNDYNAIFAGYGFMAEDEMMVAAMESAGLNFIGPCSRTVHDAGLKDEAKRTALKVGVSVTPGVDNATTLTLLKKHKDEKALLALVKKEALTLKQQDLVEAIKQAETVEDKADLVLTASYQKGIDLFTVAELQETIAEQVVEIGHKFPENRVRLKCIGGGGGKGQRILPSPSSFEGSPEERLKAVSETAPSLVLEILNEVKATGAGDNKNILIELNIETTRHQEIQVIGNGEWTIALGGRDCSLQMHEQKLLEVSVTTEDLQNALAQAVKDERDDEVKILSQDIKTLEAMEQEAERFGEAVGLDSVSTFECIVDRDKHFFMEMNTRIQVEHRVTELCYSMKFTNPDDADDSFLVTSLVEAMVLLAAHGERLPRPERVPRFTASVEARLNATNDALAPHAGGIIKYWSDPIEGEIRDDQGISLHNPDTDVFMSYHLAGAYDSNVALLLTVGNSRMASYQHLADILRVTKLEGKDLSTNLEFHYGLVNWFIGNNINARPTTRFIVPYLTAVGLLKQTASDLDVDIVYQNLIADAVAKNKGSSDEVLAAAERKALLLMRPVKQLFSNPHVLSGWLSLNKEHFDLSKAGKLEWRKNPIYVLSDAYHYLNMNYEADSPASTMIWDHDHELLQQAIEFYKVLESKTGTQDFAELSQLLEKSKAPKGFDSSSWPQVQAAHRGYQLGNDILLLLAHTAYHSGFFDLRVNKDLSIDIPESLLAKKLQDEMAKVLVPPPMAKSDEILSVSGGMYYSREAPGMDQFIQEGDHFAAGQPLYIVEVMKMFNKINAPFAGTIAKCLIENDGEIIKKGQPIFKIVPDEKIETLSPEVIAQRKTDACKRFLAAL